MENASASTWRSLLSNDGRYGVAAVASVFARHAIPVVGIVWLGWSGSKFLLLAVFNSALSLSLSGVSPATASTLIEAQRNGKPVSRVSIGLQAVAIAAVLSALLTFMLGWPIYAMSSAPVFDRGWWLALLMTILAPLPSVVADVRALTAAGLSDEQLKGIAQWRASLSIASIVPIIAMYWLIGDSRSVGTVIVVVLYTVFSIMRDLRPDLLAELARTRPAPLEDAGSVTTLDDATKRAATEYGRSAVRSARKS